MSTYSQTLHVVIAERRDIMKKCADSPRGKNKMQGSNTIMSTISSTIGSTKVQPLGCDEVFVHESN